LQRLVGWGGLIFLRRFCRDFRHLLAAGVLNQLEMETLGRSG